MREQLTRFLGCFLLVVPSIATAQVFVVSPRAGAESSYRNTVLTWLPIPGVTSYHLQVDDDPAFGSPEVDVVVGRPSYALTGEKLRLNGQLSWAAYVRVNGMRWEWPAFAPSYFIRAFWPELAVDSGGKVSYGYLGGRSGMSQAFVRTSDDFSDARRLSPPDTDGNPHGLALEVDPFGVAHAFWTEQVSGRSSLPFYAHSPDWTPLQVGDTVFGLFDVGPSIVFTAGGIEVFDEVIGAVARFTSTDGRTFRRSTVPDSARSITVDAALDPPGDILLVEERLGQQIVLQRSRTGWSPETIGTGRFPSAAVGADGVVHVLKRDEFSGEVSYSNSERAFAAWTLLPVPPVMGQQLLPIVVDNQRQQLYVASPAPDGARLCASTTAGNSWSCRPIGGAEGSHPALALDSSGVLHIAWADALGGGYTSSLGSFLAVNLPAQTRFAPPVPWPNTIIIDTAVSDGDGDSLQGSIAVGQSVHRRTTLRRDDTLEILGDSIVNSGIGLFAAHETLLFRVPGGEWSTGVSLRDVLSFPATIAVRTLDRRLVDLFTIEAWNEPLVTIDRVVFTPLARTSFTGDELPSLDLQFVPAGALTVRVSVSDGASWRAFDAPFVRAVGQNRLTLVDFRPAADELGHVLSAIPASHFKAPSLASVLRFHVDRVLVEIEDALVARYPGTRAGLLDRAHLTLRDRVLRRTDGCSAAGQVDADDWVLDCGDQGRLAAAAAQLLRAIDALREPRL